MTVDTIKCVTTSAKEPFAESNIKVLKGRIRSLISSMQFNLNSTLIVEAVKYCTTMMNILSRSSGTTNSARECMIGYKVSLKEIDLCYGDYVQIYNDHPKPFIWTKTADEILASLARFCKRTLIPGH